MFRECKWEKGDYQAFHNYLFSVQDEKYRSFQQRLLPGLEDVMIGVRIPILRKVAKDILKGNPLGFLAAPPSKYYEDIMVEGFVIAGLREDFPQVMEYVKGFIPKINNWAVCDCFVSSLRLVKKHKREFYAFLSEYLHSSEEFYVRFAVAWAVSVAYIKEKDKTLEYLQTCSLDDWTYNKALQKIVESNRVSGAEKIQIKAMKRKANKK